MKFMYVNKEYLHRSNKGKNVNSSTKASGGSRSKKGENIIKVIWETYATKINGNEPLANEILAHKKIRQQLQHNRDHTDVVLYTSFNPNQNDDTYGWNKLASPKSETTLTVRRL